MKTASVVFTRDLLSLSDLTVSSDRTANFCLESLGRPGRTPINTVASSGLVHGDVVVRSKLQEATIPATVIVQGTTTALVEERVDSLEDCLAQFYFDATVTIDGVVRVYACDPSTVSSEGVIHAHVDNYLTRLSVVLSVYPLAST